MERFSSHLSKPHLQIHISETGIQTIFFSVQLGNRSTTCPPMSFMAFLIAGHFAVVVWTRLGSRKHANFVNQEFFFNERISSMRLPIAGFSHFSSKQDAMEIEES
jgi:hypothetical protein